MNRARAAARVRIRRYGPPDGRARGADDRVAGEEPLELRYRVGDAWEPLVVTMRTPGADFELAAGFLLAEGIVRERRDLPGMAYCVDVDEDQHYNVVNVDLGPGARLPAAHELRRFAATSACGVCGKGQLEALSMAGCASVPPIAPVNASLIASLPERMRERQDLFERTGGLHAAALFGADGALLALREDVGRHNALDKLLGWAFLEGRVPVHGALVCVSGRASFELAQKCVAAGVGLLAAVSAPSSLAVDVARRFGLTLAGFVRAGRFNVYAGAERVVDDVTSTSDADRSRP
ncbi:MAG: formate dehydrogenase accessory sulfurtransferase FdhD [Trueperaceae bacterium]|nr:MAG: formate dehydrogenase accessory sulfurtransferase FdhD [Trueperaceae bacterium]